MKANLRISESQFKSKYPQEKQPETQFPDILSKKLQDEVSERFQLSSDQMRQMIKKDKSHKMSLITARDTRDISHLQDKLKKKPSSIPLQLPTSIPHLKAMLDSPISTGLFTGSISNPLTCTHKNCVNRVLSSNSLTKLRCTEGSRSLFMMNSSPELRIEALEREYLGSPSGLRDIESLNEWFKTMKNSSTSDEEAEIVYTMCGKELLRQVSVHCNLRGKVLKEVLEYQPQIFGKKCGKVTKEFQKYKEMQEVLSRRMQKEAAESVMVREEVIAGLRNSLKKSEEIREGLEQSLDKYRQELHNLQRTSLEGEHLWRKRAMDYMRELNRIKGILYIGTDKFAKFFAGDKMKQLGLDEETIEYLFKVNSEKIEESNHGTVFSERDFEYLNKFRSLLIIGSELLDADTQPRSRRNSKIDKSSPVNLLDSPSAKSKSPDLIHEPTSGKKTSRKSLVIEVNEKPYEKPQELSNQLITDRETQVFSEPSSLLSEQSLRQNENFHLVVPNMPESDDDSQEPKNPSRSEEYIKISDECEYRSNSLTDEEEVFDFLEEDHKTDNDPISFPESKRAYLGLEINEVPSHEEESRDLSAIYPESHTPQKDFQDNSEIVSTHSCSKEVQTDDLRNPIYLDKLDRFENLLEKMSIDESKKTMDTIQSIIQGVNSVSSADSPIQYRNIKRSFTQALDLKSIDSKLNSDDVANTSISSQISPFEMKIMVAEMINTVSSLVASCELKKQELVGLNEQLEVKSNVLKVISRGHVMRKRSKKDTGDSITSEHRSKTLTRIDTNHGVIEKNEGMEADANQGTWEEGYDLGFEEGRAQGYLTMLESVKGNSGYKHVLEGEVLERFDSTDLGILRRKINKVNTKFAEFNFHVPVKAVDKKKNHPGPLLLEKFLGQNLAKIKLKATVTRKNVNKILASIYTEGYQRYLADGSSNLAEVTYDEFSSRYALKTASEKKFLEFIASAVVNAEFKRSCIYIKLLGYGKLVSSQSYSKYSVVLYLSCYQYLSSSKIGFHFANDEDDKIIIPTLRATECVKEKLEYAVDKSVTNDIISKIEIKSIADPRKINAGGVVEMEAILETVVDCYEAYTGSICRGIKLCMKAMGYTEPTQVLFMDFQMILRLLGRNQREMAKEISIDEILTYCFRNNLGHEEDIQRLRREKGVFSDSREACEKNLEAIEVCVEIIGGHEEKYKTYDTNTWEERVKTLRGYMSEQETEVFSVGLALYLTEVSRLNIELGVKL